MLFISNKYTHIYFQIIEKAKTSPFQGYTESHHIIPKSLGGDNSPDNLVNLSAKAHWLVHKLLTKMTVGDNKRKMYYAFSMFRLNKTGDRILTSKQYNESKEAFSIAHSKRIVADESIALQKESLKKYNKTKDHICEHCNNAFTGSKYHQFHGDKCKYNPNVDRAVLLARSNRMSKAAKQTTESKMKANRL